MATSQGTLNSGATQHKILIPVLICLALAILTVITFWSLKNCSFINYDDNLYVYENAYVQSGLNANNVVHAFSSELMKISGHWCPVTWLSLMLDYSIFGLNPSGYHLVNLLLHVMNTLLLFLILHRMTKTIWPSAFVATLFAIHPLHVESVAWITERKDVLSTFFWMLTLGAYSYYVEHPRFRRYAFVFLFFILGLLTKSMLVTLPFVLLLLDYWPLYRFQGIKPNDKVQTEILKSVSSDKQINKPAYPEYKWSVIYPLLCEKIPFFVLAILSSTATYVAAQIAEGVHSDAFPLSVRIGNAFISYIAYIGKMMWPANLAVFYPYPKSLVTWQVLGSAFLLIAITLVIVWKAKKFPYLATGWLWYLGTLVPVIGIVQVGNQAMADRYTYIPMIGLFIMVAWAIPSLIKGDETRKKILFPIGITCIILLAVLTWQQCGYWKNSVTLYNHALQATKDNYLAHNNLGVTLVAEGKTEKAIYHYNKAILIKPDYVEAYTNRGNAYFRLGQNQRAIEDYNEAIRLKADYVEAYTNRGSAYFGLGQHQRAIEDYNEAIRLKPDYVEAYTNRGLAHFIMRNNKLCCLDMQKVCALGNCRLLEDAKRRGICR